MKKLLAVMLFSFILILAGCGETATKKPIEPVLDVEQFSLASESIIRDKLGEPLSVNTFNFETPSTGAKNVLKYLDYDWNGYYSEFIFDDKDRLIRINIYTDDNEESKFVKTTFKDLLIQLSIIPDENLTKIADTGAAWRYQRVSEKVDEVWALDELGEEDKIGIIKISFDVRPFM